MLSVLATVNSRPSTSTPNDAVATVGLLGQVIDNMEANRRYSKPYRQSEISRQKQIKNLKIPTDCHYCRYCCILPLNPHGLRRGGDNRQ